MMFSSRYLLVFLAIYSVAVTAEESPRLDGLPNIDQCAGILESYGVKPLLVSEVEPGNRTIPDINVTQPDGTWAVIAGDSRHLVVPPVPSESGETKHLVVSLPPTNGRPTGLICYTAAIAQQGYPIISLMNEYLNSPDAIRSKRCLNTYGNHTPEFSQCLDDMHNDAIFGGDHGMNGTLWQAIDPRDSIHGRLSLLLSYLMETSTSPELWGPYINNATEPWSAFAPYEPNYSNIWVTGLSQGASHATYMAYSLKLKGAGFFAGPQDDYCHFVDPNSSNPCWVQRPFATADIRGVVHGLEEAYPVVSDNWKHMFDGKPLYDIENATNDNMPLQQPWVTYVQPNPAAPGKYHRSLNKDPDTPYFVNGTYGPDDNPAVYAKYLWPQISGIVTATPSTNTTGTTTTGGAEPTTSSAISTRGYRLWATAIMSAVLGSFVAI